MRIRFKFFVALSIILHVGVFVGFTSVFFPIDTGDGTNIESPFVENDIEDLVGEVPWESVGTLDDSVFDSQNYEGLTYVQTFNDINQLLSHLMSDITEQERKKILSNMLGKNGNTKKGRPSFISPKQERSDSIWEGKDLENLLLDLQSLSKTFKEFTTQGMMVAAEKEDLPYLTQKQLEEIITKTLEKFLKELEKGDSMHPSSSNYQKTAHVLSKNPDLKKTMEKKTKSALEKKLLKKFAQKLMAAMAHVQDPNAQCNGSRLSLTKGSGSSPSSQPSSTKNQSQKKSKHQQEGRSNSSGTSMSLAKSQALEFEQRLKSELQHHLSSLEWALPILLGHNGKNVMGSLQSSSEEKLSQEVLIQIKQEREKRAQNQKNPITSTDRGEQNSLEKNLFNSDEKLLKKLVQQSLKLSHQLYREQYESEWINSKQSPNQQNHSSKQNQKLRHSKDKSQDVVHNIAKLILEQDLKDIHDLLDSEKREVFEILRNIPKRDGPLQPNLNQYGEHSSKIDGRVLNSSRVKQFKGSRYILADEEGVFFPNRIFLIKTHNENHKQIALPDLVIPNIPTHAYGGVRRADRKIKLDGELSEWKEAFHTRLVGKAMGEEPLPNYLKNCNYLLTQWDNHGLYFAYWIKDDMDNRPTIQSFWDGDALEIFLDPENKKSHMRKPGENYQFWIWPRHANIQGSTGRSEFVSVREFMPIPLNTPKMRFASKKYRGGYSCEAFIHASMLGNFRPRPGKLIGFNYSINNGKNVYLRWLTNMGANVSQHPNLWGDLMLLGTSATIVLSPKKFLLPGSNLKISVRDMDMNLSRDKPDRITVKVTSQLTGTHLMVHLIEKGKNSGKFLGEIATTFHLDGAQNLDKNHKPSQSLQVKPGDKIRVTYLDQFRKMGKKDVRIKKEIPVGRAFFSMKL